MDDALRLIAESHNYVCAERLEPNLVSMAQHLAVHGELHLSPALLEELERISMSTIRLRLEELACLETWRLPRRRKPRPASPLLRDVPMGRIPWDEHGPGHFEGVSWLSCVSRMSRYGLRQS